MSSSPAGVSRLMGLVVALRFLSWGALVSALAGFLLVEAVRFPQLLDYVAIPTLFAAYLLATGQVLLLIRTQGWPSRFLLVAPLIMLLVVGTPSVRSSVTLVSLALGAALGLYLEGVRRQAEALEHRRAAAWFGRLRWALLLALLVAAFGPGAAAPLAVFGGLIFLGATVAGWRIWLTELRASILEQENL